MAHKSRNNWNGGGGGGGGGGIDFFSFFFFFFFFFFKNGFLTNFFYCMETKNVCCNMWLQINTFTV